MEKQKKVDEKTQKKRSPKGDTDGASFTHKRSSPKIYPKHREWFLKWIWYALYMWYAMHHIWMTFPGTQLTGFSVLMKHA